MNELLSTLINVLSYHFFLRFVIGTALFCGQLCRKPRFSLRLLACLLSYVIAGIFVLPVRTDSVLASVLYYFIWFLLMFFWLWVCFDELWQTLLFCCVAGYTTQQLAGSVNTILTSVLNYAGIPFPYSSSDFFSWLSFQAVFIVTYCLVYLLIARKNRTYNHMLKFTQLIPISFGTLLVNIILQTVAVQHNIAGRDFPSACVVYGYNIAACLFIYYLLFGSLMQNRMKAEIEALNELRVMQQRQYQLSKDTIDSVNIKCHDLKHQIRTLTKNASVLPETIQSIEKTISIYDAAYKTGNEALDVILTEKSLLCQEQGIRLSCVADGPSLSFIRDADLYNLMGNALDNAIEAIQKLAEDEKKMITVKIRSDEYFTVIHICNPFAGEIILENDLPVTSKENRNDHGFGMRSISKIVEFYGGTLSIEYNDGMFDLGIVFQRGEDLIPSGK